MRPMKSIRVQRMIAKYMTELTPTATEGWGVLEGMGPSGEFPSPPLTFPPDNQRAVFRDESGQQSTTPTSHQRQLEGILTDSPP